MKYSEIDLKDLQERIVNVLEKDCPAFVRINYPKTFPGAEVGIHTECRCKAQKPWAINRLQSCECLWHLTDTCVAGTWPQLSFIAKILTEDRNESYRWLVKAKQAVIKTEQT